MRRSDPNDILTGAHAGDRRAGRALAAHRRHAVIAPVARTLFALAMLALAPAVSAQRVWTAPSTPAPAPAVPTTVPLPSPPSAASGGTPQGSGDYLSRMDADRDGKVALIEYQDWLSYAFDSMDRDRDGTLSPDEQPGGRGQALTREAHRARLAERFRRQDVDRSGFLDARELAAPPQGR